MEFLKIKFNDILNYTVSKNNTNTVIFLDGKNIKKYEEKFNKLDIQFYINNYDKIEMKNKDTLYLKRNDLIEKLSSFNNRSDLSSINEIFTESLNNEELSENKINVLELEILKRILGDNIKYLKNLKIDNILILLKEIENISNVKFGEN